MTLSEWLIQVTELKKLVEPGWKMHLDRLFSFYKEMCCHSQHRASIHRHIHTEIIHSTYTWRTPIQEKSTHTSHINPHSVYRTYTQQLTWCSVYKDYMAEGTCLFPGQGSVSATRWEQCEEGGGVAGLGSSVTVHALRVTALQLRSQRLGAGRPVILWYVWVCSCWRQLAWWRKSEDSGGEWAE